MELTKNEKEILTLIDVRVVDGFAGWAQKHVSCSENEIIHIVDKLIRLGFVEKIAIKKGPSKGKLLYSHTNKVKRNMLDENLHYKYGSASLYTYA